MALALALAASGWGCGDPEVKVSGGETGGAGGQGGLGGAGGQGGEIGGEIGGEAVSPPEACPEAPSLVLALLNDEALTAAALIQLGLPAWAAENLIERRQGLDGITGTEDDHRFTDVAEIADPYFGGPATLTTLYGAVGEGCAAVEIPGPEPTPPPHLADEHVAGAVTPGEPLTGAELTDPDALPGPPRLRSVEVAGVNIVVLRFNKDLEPEDEPWTALLRVLVAEGAEAPAAWPLIEGWQPPEDPRQVILATADPLPLGATVEVQTTLGAPVSFNDDFGEAGVTVSEVAPDQSFSLDLSEDQAGWSFYPASADGVVDPGWAWTPEGLVSVGGQQQETTVEAVGPLITAGQDFKVSVVFQVFDEDGPYDRHAFPRVNLRALNEHAWIGCYIRNDLNRIVPGEPPHYLSPALNCAYQNALDHRTYFEGCRYQFYVDEANGGARYDWLTYGFDRHRLEVIVVGDHLRAQMFNVDRPQGGPVAVVDVPDLTVDGPIPTLGMAGLGGFDSGRALFTEFSVSPASGADLPDLDPRWAPLEGCP